MTVILDARGVTVAALETSQTIAAGDSTCFVQQLAVPNPNLWSPTNPYLYTVRSTLSDPENVADVYDTLFGIREAVFDAERGFLLNGHQIKLRVHPPRGGQRWRRGSASRLGAPFGNSEGNGLQCYPHQP